MTITQNINSRIANNSKNKNNILILILALAIAGATAWKNTLAVEYTGPGCKGQVNKAWVGWKWEQIKMRNSTQSVYLSTVNDGIYRWYGFSGATADGAGCEGDLVGRLPGPCFDLSRFAVAAAEDDPNNNNNNKTKALVKCIRCCSLWVKQTDPMSCAFFGAGGDDEYTFAQDFQLTKLR